MCVCVSVCVCVYSVQRATMEAILKQTAGRGSGDHPEIDVDRFSLRTCGEYRCGCVCVCGCGCACVGVCVWCCCVCGCVCGGLLVCVCVGVQQNIPSFILDFFHNTAALLCGYFCLSHFTFSHLAGAFIQSDVQGREKSSNEQ